MIEASNLGMSFDPSQKTWVFRKATFKVTKGSSFVILGPSGSGKSTLLKILAGLITPTEGSVRLQTENVGMLFQKNALFDSLTVLENLMMPLRECKNEEGKEAEKKSRTLIDQVGLSHAVDLYPSEISGGMQKRLGIARALVLEPDVLLYDDPTAGLDPITSRSIAELIRSSQKERGTTLVCVTNDVNRAYQLGDQIALLAQGQLQMGGTPDQVRHTKDPSLKQFIQGLTQGPLQAEGGA